MIYYLAVWMGLGVVTNSILTVIGDSRAKRWSYFVALILQSIAVYGVYQLWAHCR